MTRGPHVFAEGDLVRVRDAAGVWTIRQLLLVRGEAEIIRSAHGQGQIVRHVPVDQLIPVTEAQR